MRIPNPDQTKTSPTVHRVVCYWQTHHQDGKFVSILPLLGHRTGVTHVVVAAIHLNKPAGNITLNDDDYKDPKNIILWHEVQDLQGADVKVLGMLGGAALGSFTVLDGDTTSFRAYYEPLRQMIAWTGLDGLDLDVEEHMSLAGIIRLIDQLKTDFGSDFLITLAPVATALQGKDHLSGFDYADLEKAFGSKIAWYNTQFYCGWGTMENPDGYEEIMKRGWPAEKVVAGLVTNPANCKGWVGDKALRKTLSFLVKKYPGFGGVMGWEYFNSMTEETPEGKPWSWAQMMTDIMRS
ncbi:MAG: hypothetical protein Q9187_009652 [Circinaria calcarea]